MSDNPLNLLKEELENDDIQIKVNAIHRFPVIMAVFPPEKIISEFIPYIQKIIPTEEDEVLLAISEELPHFKTYLDGKQMTAVLPLFQLFQNDNHFNHVFQNHLFLISNFFLIL